MNPKPKFDISDLQKKKTTHISKRKRHQKPLLILDLNGLFVQREFKEGFEEEILPPGTSRLGKFIVWKRRGLGQFLKFAFKNFTVAVWSSVTRYNIRELVNHVFGPKKKKKLIFVWDQKMCESVEHPNEAMRELKSLFLKNLSSVWSVYKQFNESNTLIVDDSKLKMRNNPVQCCVVIKEWNKSDFTSMSKDYGIIADLAEYALFF